MKNLIYLLVIFFAAFFYSFCQLETSNWIISQNHWIKFDINNPPKYNDLSKYGLPTTNIPWPANTSISDSNGNIIFFIFNDCVYNKNFEKIHNSELSDNFSTASTIIVPHPLSDSIYYIFNCRIINVNGKYHSKLICFTIDISYDGGKGAIISKTLIEENVWMSLSAIRQINGRDYWVACSKLNSNGILIIGINKSGFYKNTYYMGANLEVKYSVTYLLPSYNMKFSPNGRLLAIPKGEKNLVDIIRFNNRTGELSKLKSITYEGLKPSNPTNVEFSNNSKLLYISTSRNYSVIQYGIDNDFDQISFQNATTIFETIYFPNWRSTCPLQLSCDGKIYTFGLNMINNPSIVGVGCNYEENVIPLEGKSYSLPLFPSSYFHEEEVMVCEGDAVNLRSADTMNEEARSFRWKLNYLDNGDTARASAISHMLDTMAARGDSIFTATLDMSGEYYVRVTNYDGRTYGHKVHLYVNKFPKAGITIIGDTNKCTSVILKAKPDSLDFSYKWSTGDTTKAIETDSSGFYYVAVTNSSGCTDTAFYYLTKPEPPLAEIKGPTEICKGMTAILYSKYSDSMHTYNWSTGEATPAIEATELGKYRLIVSNKDGCSDTAYHDLKVLPGLDVRIDSPGGICTGESSVLKALPDGKEYTYLWSTGDTTSIIEVRSEGTYWVKVELGASCGGNDTVQLIIFDKPVADIKAGKLLLCPGESTELTAEPGGMQYLWSTGDTSRVITIPVGGDYTLVITSPDGCRDTAMINIQSSPPFYPAIAGPRELCKGTNAVLESLNDYPSYLWSNGETTKSIIIKNAGQYWLKATNEFGCTARDTIEVTEIETKLELPDILAFDSLCFGGSQTLDIEITNAGNSVITIDDISISGSGFSLDRPFQPFILDSGVSVPLKLLFTPESPGNNSGELIIYSASPCALWDTVRLTAHSKPVVHARAGEAFGYPGDKICIPVYGRLSGNTPEPIGLDYLLSLSFPLKSFFPESPDEGTILGDKRIVNLSGTSTFTAIDNKLGEVCGQILLYPDSIVSVDINAFSTEEYVTCNDLEPGIIRIFPVCTEGTRLIELINKPVLNISPNPVRDELTITTNQEIDKIEIYSAIGLKVGVHCNEPSQKEKIDVSELPTGLYLIQFHFRLGSIMNYRFMKE